MKNTPAERVRRRGSERTHVVAMIDGSQTMEFVLSSTNNRGISHTKVCNHSTNRVSVVLHGKYKINK